MYVVSIFIVVSIILGVSYSNFIVTSNNHKAAEMYIGALKYSIEIDGNSTNTLTIPTGETIIDVKVNNQNPVDTYYKLLYLKNSNLTVKYYETTKDTDDVVTTYSKPNDSVTNSNSNTIKLKITNSSTSSQNIGLSVKGGYITNTVDDITVPSGYTTIEKDTSTNTYFCTTTDTLTQGLKYVNGQYTYAYKQEGAYASSGIAWSNINNNGWGVQLSDKTSTNAVTSKVCTYINNKPITSMSNMFESSQSRTLDLSNFDTSNVTNMRNMFMGSKATTIDVSNFDTSNVTNMYAMFYDSQATALDLSNFDTSNVTNMRNMFMGSKATTIDVSNFNTSKVTSMSDMFHLSQATTIDVSNFDTSKVTDMFSMFMGSKATTIDVSNFNTSKVTDMTQMFSNSQATALDVSNFDTSNVIDMMSMFSGSQTTILDVSNFDTSNVTNMYAMFSNSQATALDVSNFNTSKVRDMSYMFRGSKVTTLDLSNFDTSNVTNMNWMFSGSQATILDVSNFDTSKVIDMGYMFYRSTYLKTIYVSNKFNTDKVTSSTYMFNGCTKLVGGAGTKYNSSHVDKAYAHIDGGTSNPGYFTDIADKPSEPNSFSTDSWPTIINAVKNNNISKYNVGDTRTIDMGTYGTHTLRIANTSTPSECSTTGFSQSACGFVLEFADIITKHAMNDTTTNVGGWPSSSMYAFVNNDIYNAIPSEIKNAIIDTTVVSGHGSKDTENFTSTDKLYLLAPKEIYTDWANTNSNDTAKDLTRTLDYYKNLGTSTSNYSGAIKKKGISAEWWWLRTASSSTAGTFYIMVSTGGYTTTDARYDTTGVAPAFRIG